MDIRVSCNGAACVMAALFLLVLPLDWAAAALGAATFHELCHLFAVLCAGGNVYSLHIGMGGAVITASPMNFQKTILTTLAGPLGSLSLLAVSGHMPRLSLCGLVQGVFNLIPVLPLDGGRLLHCILEQACMPDRARGICDAIKWMVVILAFAAGIWAGWGIKLGIAPVLAAVFFVFRALDIKIPCKERDPAVQ